MPTLNVEVVLESRRRDAPSRMKFLNVIYSKLAFGGHMLLLAKIANHQNIVIVLNKKMAATPFASDKKMPAQYVLSNYGWQLYSFVCT